jgi:hypothetical protein
MNLSKAVVSLSVSGIGMDQIETSSPAVGTARQSWKQRQQYREVKIASAK